MKTQQQYEQWYATAYATTYKPAWMDWPLYERLAITPSKQLSRDERGLLNSITCAPRNSPIMKPWEEGRWS